MPKLETFDQPIVFLLAVSLGVAAVFALFAWLFAVLGWSGPLGLFKGGVAG